MKLQPIFPNPAQRTAGSLSNRWAAPVSLESMSGILKKSVLILFVAFAALTARAWGYDGPGREWTVRGIGLREWVVVRQTQTVSVRTEFCAGSYHYAVKGPIERACISCAVLIAFPAILFFGNQRDETKMILRPNRSFQATPGSAILFFLAPWPGVPASL